MQLSVIIVNYNVKHFLEQCLCSVLKACSHIEAEVIVLDNQSSDGSKAFFNNRFKKVQFVWKTENAGFAKANNQGWQMACGKYVLFLNPDTLVAEDSLHKCISFMEQHPDAGALGVQMIDGSGYWLPESKRGFPSPWVSFCKFTGLTRRFPHSVLFAGYYLGHLSKLSSHRVAVLSGACMLVKRDVLEKTHGFDENFFMYAEDIDLSYRIQQAGYANYYFADTTVIHFKGESTIKESRDYIKRFYGTMIQFVRKHYRGLSRLFYEWLLRAVIALKLLFIRKKPANNKVILQECCYVLGMPNKNPELEALLAKYFKKWTAMNTIDEAPAGAAVLLCEAGLSFKKIISIMAQHPGGYQYFIHADGANVINGSATKGQQGVSLT